MTYEQLGNIMIAEVGETVCLNSYDTNDPAMVGRVALGWGDINPDGTTN